MGQPGSRPETARAAAARQCRMSTDTYTCGRHVRTTPLVPNVLNAPDARSKLIGRYGALLPLFRLVGVPCIAAFRRVKSLLRHHSDRPKLANSFRRCDLFDWRFFGFGFFAMLIRGVQEPSDEAGAALLHYRRILGLLLIVEEPVIFRVAHGILHLLSAPNIKQLRNTVYCSRVAGILDRGSARHLIITCGWDTVALLRSPAMTFTKTGALSEHDRVTSRTSSLCNFSSRCRSLIRSTP
jgi:hypothetical protein